MKRVLLSITCLAVGSYLLVAAILFFSQRSLIFPAPDGAATLPEGFDRVIIRTSDGLDLVAAYRPAIGKKPTIVFFHGNGDSWAGGAGATRLLANGGYGVMLPEYRGYAGNAGLPSEQGLYADGRAAIRWLESRGVQEAKLVIIGNSVGSGVATQMAVEVRPAALILVSPFSSLPDVVSEKLPWLPASLLVRDKFRNRAKISRIAEPVLLLHGVADELIPAHHSEQLARALPGAALELVPNVGHDLAYRPDAQQIELAWLDGLFSRDGHD